VSVERCIAAALFHSLPLNRPHMSSHGNLRTQIVNITLSGLEKNAVLIGAGLLCHMNLVLDLHDTRTRNQRQKNGVELLQVRMAYNQTISDACVMSIRNRQSRSTLNFK